MKDCANYTPLSTIRLSRYLLNTVVSRNDITMKPKIGIIIVTYNSSKWIVPCLASVFGSNYDGEFTVYVVDNASNDDSVKLVKKEFLQAVSIHLPKNTGFAGGNNAGIKKALDDGCEYIILLNPDTRVEYDWLSQMERAASSNSAGVMQGMLLLGNEQALTNNVGNALHYLGFGFVKHYRERVDAWYHREPFEIQSCSGACMLIKKEVIEKIGMLDEKLFMYHEDLDFSWRAQLAGFSVMIAPQATVYHYYEFSRNKKLFYWTERNRLAVLLQNYCLRTLLLLLPMLVFIEFAMLGYSVLGRWARYKLLGYGWVIAHLPQIIATRRRVQKKRALSDREMIKRMEAKLEMSEVENPILKYIVSPIAVLYYRIIRNVVL